MRLTDFPPAETIFIDANCFIYHFTGTYRSCATLLERSRQRALKTVTSTSVVLEVHHRLMTVEAARQRGRRRNMPSFLKWHPEIIQGLRHCEVALEQLRLFRVRIVPITPELVSQARLLSHQIGLLTNDALVIATMRAHRLTHLASNDTDFLRVPNLTLWRP